MTWISIHVPKTAGTTLRTVLASRIPEDQIALIYDRPPGRSLRAFLSGVDGPGKRYRLVHGHFAFGLHHHLGAHARYLTFLRHPVQRVASLYFHNYCYPHSAYHDVIHSQGLSLADFVRLRLTPQSENSMTQFVAGIEHVAGGDRLVFRSGCPAHLLDVARENIEIWFDFVGITERMDESMRLLGEVFEHPLGPAPHVNRTPVPSASAGLDPAAVEMIAERNALDLELYRFAERRLAQGLEASRGSGRSCRRSG